MIKDHLFKCFQLCCAQFTGCLVCEMQLQGLGGKRGVLVYESYVFSCIYNVNTRIYNANTHIYDENTCIIYIV